MDKAYYAFPCNTVLPAYGDVHRRGEASMVALDDERAMIVYTNHSQHKRSDLSPIEGDNDTAAICATVLDRDGLPVGEERVLIETPENALNVMSPAIRWLPDGTLGMLYSNRLSKKTASRMIVKSYDEGVQWSTPMVVAEGAYTTGCHDRFTVLSSGRLIVPLHRTQDWDWHYLYVQVAYSDDCGVTWALSNKLSLPFVGKQYGWDGGFIESGCVEPTVAERADGSLLMSIRTAMGTLFCAESFDEGKTWIHLRSMEVASPQAPAHLSRIPETDDLLLLWTPNYDIAEHLSGKRHTIMACISKDGGKTWNHNDRKVLVHHPECSVDYPAVMYKGKDVWITFRQSSTNEISGGKTSSNLMIVPLSWLYA